MPDLHPRNSGFAWRPSLPPYEAISSEQAAQYDENGFFLFERAFSDDEVDEVSAAIEPHEQAGEAWLRQKEGGRHLIARADAITFTIHLVARSEVLKRFSRHPVLRSICRDTIGRGARLYWDQAVYKKPGTESPFPWHQDNGYAFLEPQQYLTCWVALNDATLDNGCPWVMPGLHRMGTLEHHVTRLGYECLTPPALGAVAVPAKKGDIVVFSSLTPHRTGPNLTGEVRKSYILQYAGDGARVRRSADDAGVVQDDAERQFRIS